MEFEGIIVKDHPGVCRCCLSEGCYKDLSTEYMWMGESEIYADMLMECFDISISQHSNGLYGSSRLICEVCITRLRDACNFKKQVLESEQRYVDMLSRRELRPGVLSYEQPMKEEFQVEITPMEDDEGAEEYLEDEMDFLGDDTDESIKEELASGQKVGASKVQKKKVTKKRGIKEKKIGKEKTVLLYDRPVKEELQVEVMEDEMDFLGDASDDTDKEDQEEDSSVAKKRLPRRQKNVASKIQKNKATKKGGVKEEKIGKEKIGKKSDGKKENSLEKLNKMRKNIEYVLYYGKVVPFQWITKGYLCFYCKKLMKDVNSLKDHTVTNHGATDLNALLATKISKDLPVKVDVSDVGCKVCENPMRSLEELIEHITDYHEEEYDVSAGICFLPFLLQKDEGVCAICDAKFDNFACLIAHMFKTHMEHKYVCQNCGLTFMNSVKLKVHIRTSHVGFRCKICDKLFDAYHKMARHRDRIHGHEKTHTCNMCNETFKNEYQVKVHMGKVHQIEKYRIRCDLCPKICTTKGAMVLHVQSQHLESRYECDMCDYKTAIRWVLKLHKRKHFGERKYACSVCDKRFGSSSNLRAHMKVHTGNTGRTCRWCKKGFTGEDILNAHEKEEHYYKQYI